MSPEVAKFIKENPYFMDVKQDTKNLVELLVFNYQCENIFFLSTMVDFHLRPSIALATFIATIFIKPKSPLQINISKTDITLSNYRNAIIETQEMNQKAQQVKRGFFSKKPTPLISMSLQQCFDSPFNEIFKSGELVNILDGVTKNYTNNQNEMIRSIQNGSFDPNFNSFGFGDIGVKTRSQSAKNSAVDSLSKFKASFQALGLVHLAKIYKIVENLKV